MRQDGFILIDKPQDITSFVAVAVIRRAVGVKHAGHSGTLDPLATGLLPIFTGKATKLTAFMLEGDKSYRATLRFGSATDTLDITGEVTETGGRIPTKQELLAVLPRFTGKISQIPPMYSALKKDGVPLYKRARKGEQIELNPRAIEIYRLALVSYEKGEAVLDIDCSKGTYIRSLCRDIAAALDTFGTMSALVRTATCGFSLAEALPLYEAEERLKNGEDILQPPEAALKLPHYMPPAFFARLLRNGCAIDEKKLKGIPADRMWVRDEGGLIGIGELTDGTLKIKTHL